MRFLILILVIVGVGLALDWVKSSYNSEVQRLKEKPTSEKYIPGNLQRGKVGAVKMTLHDFQRAITQFVLTKSRRPEGLRELISEGLLQPGSDVDPFGQQYLFQYVGDEAVVSSPGPDKVKGTADDMELRVRVE